MNGDVTRLLGEVAYLHERLDQLIRISALEVSQLRQRAGIDVISDHSMHLTLNRFWAADNAAGEKFGRPSRREVAR